MKRLIIISLILAATFLFISGSIAGWNEGGFKNSPLFKHSLNEAITNMENQGKQVRAEGESKATTTPNCNVPDAPLTSLGQPTCYETCEPTQCGGECYTQAYTCSPTACGLTCMGGYTSYGYSTCGSTCGGTCQSTCQSTCESTCQSTCQSTCSCPPVVRGTVYHWVSGTGGPGDPKIWSNYWGPTSHDRIVNIYTAPQYRTNFNDEDGYYDTDEFGGPPCGLYARGWIGSQQFGDYQFKQDQNPGGILIINFYCEK